MDPNTISDLDIERLNDKEKSELRTFLANEQQKARVQSTVHALTDMCWKKCVTGSIRQGQLDRTEDSCMRNCVDRFLDASSLTMKQLQNMRLS